MKMDILVLSFPLKLRVSLLVFIIVVVVNNNRQQQQQQPSRSPKIFGVGYGSSTN